MLETRVQVRAGVVCIRGEQGRKLTSGERILKGLLEAEELETIEEIDRQHLQ